MIHQKKKTTLIFANRKKGQGRMMYEYEQNT